LGGNPCFTALGKKSKIIFKKKGEKDSEVEKE